MRKFALAVLTALTLVACSRSAPPTGRWEGVYETNDTMIAARLEIGADGQAKISAPDLLDIGNASADERTAMRQKLAGDLATGWGDVVPRKLDFDGETFRKPGGIAPQMIWKEKVEADVSRRLSRHPAFDPDRDEIGRRFQRRSLDVV